MASDYIGGSTLRYFLHLNNQALLILTKHEVLVFKVFGSGPSNLVTLIYGYQHLTSLVVVTGN